MTAYNAPSNRALSELGLDKTSCVAVTELSTDEVAAIIVSAGGNGTRWSRAVYNAGAFGHPQLVMAVVSGRSAILAR